MKRILLADDEESLLLAYQKLLHAPGVTIDSIQSVADAQKMLEENFYDAVIVDLRLTGTMEMDGIQIISGTKKRYPQSKIIALSAYCDNQIKQKVIKAGASYLFEKPVSVLLIKELLEKLGIYSEIPQLSTGN
ncbi:MAG: response regulator [Fibrobacter sp.]|jgi:DNA-binding NtrC family response regulator|nr:response regulator [Fibrobacter sp.]